VFVFTADHGDMRQCQGLDTKVVPFDESVLVPFLLRYPRLTGRGGRQLPVPIDAPDIMPTLLGLAGLPVPASVEGTDWSPVIRGERQPSGDEAALLIMPSEFTELCRNGMAAYRGLRTARHSYVRSTRGPWLLFDNQADPYQMRNLIRRPDQQALQDRLDAQLQERLRRMGDEFREGRYYLEQRGLTHYGEVYFPAQRQWRYPWDEV